MKKEIIISLLAVFALTLTVVAAPSVRKYQQCNKVVDKVCATVYNVDADSLVAFCEANIDSLCISYNIDSFDDTVAEGDAYQDYLDAMAVMRNATDERTFCTAIRWYLTAYRGVIDDIKFTAELQNDED